MDGADYFQLLQEIYIYKLKKKKKIVKEERLLVGTSILALSICLTLTSSAPTYLISPQGAGSLFMLIENFYWRIRPL